MDRDWVSRGVQFLLQFDVHLFENPAGRQRKLLHCTNRRRDCLRGAVTIWG
jgi:hypothetical protein